MKPIVFVVEGSSKKGLGSVAGPLLIADELRKRYDITFVLDGDDSAAGLVARNGFRVLKASSADEAAKTASRLEAGFALTAFLKTPRNVVKILQSSGKKVASMEYLPGQKLSDAFINHTVMKKWHDYPNNKKRFLGPSFALIHPEFARERSRRKRKSYVLITMGGSDRADSTLKIVRALRRLDIPVVVVAGPAFRRFGLLKKLVKGRKSVKIERSVPHSRMASLMAGSVLAFSAGGNTLYELAYLGIPTIVVSGDAHETLQGREFQKLGAALFAGRDIRIRDKDIYIAASYLLAGRDKMKTMSEKGRALVDGKGISRIVRIIESMTV